MDEDDDFIEPDRGVLNPAWVLRHTIQNTSLSAVVHGLEGLSRELCEWEPDTMFSRDEIVDIVLQHMYTGEYVNPFLHACEVPGITEEEIQTFTNKLDFFGKDTYTDVEQDDEEGGH